MTRPTGRVGRVDAELRVTTDRVDDDVHEGLEEAGRVGDRDMKKLGKDLGDTFDDELKKSTKNTGRDVARSISSGIEREGFRVTKMTAQFDSDGNLIRRWITSEIEKAPKVIGELASSGAFSKVGSAFSDAIGAGFNISGKSPLIGALGPVIAAIASLIGFIVEVVGAAIQAVSSLVAVLALVPNLLFSIGLQAGVLLLAFHGIAEAAQGAFAAKNADELNEAIKNLTPSAQEFVKSLLPLKDFFTNLSKVAQEGFFSKFGDTLTKITNALGPQLSGQVSAIAEALGTLFSRVLLFFGSPVFQRFLTAIVPAITKWLDDMGPALFSFLFGLTTFGEKLIPFLTWFGTVFTEALSNIGGWLNDLSHDKDFLDWLERMKETFMLTGEAILNIGKLLASFASALDKAGGNELIKALSEQLVALAGFFQSDVGIKSLEGLIRSAIFLSEVFIGLIVVLFTFFFLIETTAEFAKVLFTEWFPNWLATLGQWWVDTFTAVLSFLSDFFTNKIPEFFVWIGAYIQGFFENLFMIVSGFIAMVITAISAALGWVISQIFNLGAAIATWVHDRAADIGDFFSNLGQMIADTAGNMLGTLYQAGRNLIQGLINGVKSMFGALGNAASQAVQVVRDFLPFSPAKEGPLSGSGDPLIAGQKIVERIAAGIEMEAPAIGSATSNAVSNVNVGAGAVQLNFYGQTPTAAQAGSIGAAAGNSLADTIAQRNTRLGIRTIGTAAAIA